MGLPYIVFTKCPLRSFSPWLCLPSVMVVTQDRRDGVLCGVTGHQSQLSLGHCCICTDSCKASPPLVQVIPAIVILIMCNSNHGLQRFKGLSVTIEFDSKKGMVFVVSFCKWQRPNVLAILSMSILMAYGSADFSFMLRGALALVQPAEDSLFNRLGA